MMAADTFALSGPECAFGLRELGFELVRREPGKTFLRRGKRLIVVPDVLVLPTSVLDAILACADVSYDVLLKAVDDIPTRPDLPTLSP